MTERNKRAAIIALIFSILACTQCHCEALRINEMAFTKQFPSQKMLNEAISAITAEKIIDLPDKNPHFRVISARFRDGKILVSYYRQDDTIRSPAKEYWLVFSLDGHFIDGFYIEDSISNGGGNVFYSDGTLYIYHVWSQCLYSIDKNAQISYYYVPGKYAYELTIAYHESVEGYTLQIKETETSNSVILTDKDGIQTEVFSDNYDSSWKKQGKVLLVIFVIVAVVSNVYIERNRRRDKRKAGR